MESSLKILGISLLGNAIVATAKLGAALFTGSASMLAEAAHSISDTLSILLLYVGFIRGRKPPDAEHPFGYGKEEFFWALRVAVLSFGIAGSLSLYRGVNAVIEPHALVYGPLNFIIIGFSSLFELIGLAAAIRELKREIPGASFSNIFRVMQESRNPNVIAVVLDNIGDLLGLAMAAGALALSELSRQAIYDAIGSVAIGLMLISFGVFLAFENRALLIGEAISLPQRTMAIELIEGLLEVNRVLSLRTMYLSPRSVLFGIEVNLKDGLSTEEVEMAVDRIEHAVKAKFPHAKYVYVDIENL